MKFSLIFLILIFISSCSNGLVNKNNRDPFTSSGFALIYNDDDFKNTPLNKWRPFAFLLFANWLNQLYQKTPYDLTSLAKK